MSNRAETLRRRFASQRGLGAPDSSVVGAASLVEAFGRVASRCAGRVAVRYDGRSVSYRELDEMSSALAAVLRSHAGSSGLVGVLLERSVDMVTAAVGTLKAGMSYLPLDPDSPAARLAMIVEDAAPVIVVTSQGLASLVPDGVPVVVMDEPLPAALFEEPRVDASARAYVIFTSGTTGRPKGVEVTHGNVLRLFSTTERLFGFGPDDVWTMFHSFAFDFSVWEMWGALLYGGCVVVVPQDIARDPVTFRRLLRDERVTVLNQTPTAFRSLLATEERRWPDQLPLKWVIFGGEALHFPDLTRWIAQYGDEQPQLINMYGITETTVHSSHRRIRQDDLAQTQSLIGQPLPDLDFLLLDDNLDPVPAGQIGEIIVTGPGVATGYLGRPELTRERFIELPDQDGSTVRGYRSGDLARRTPTGDHEYHGRKDDQVKIRGYRIELNDVRRALSCLESVTDAAVVARDLPGLGKSLVGYLVGNGSPLTLRTALKRVLPEHMIPSAFVFLHELPRTQNGKLDRDSLPEPELKLQVEAPAENTDEVEAKIMTVLTALLSPNPVSRTADFFDLGGHSLLATRLLAEVNDDFGIDVRLREFLRAPTAHSLAVVVRQKRAGLRPTVEGALISLRQDSAGATPVFALPGVLGFGTSYRQLCAHFPGRSFSALHLGDLVNAESTADTLIDVCATTIAHATDRPIHLIGHSMGGCLAFYLVDALRSRGMAVESLTLLDAPSPLWLAGRPERTRGEQLWYFLGELAMVFPDLAEAWRDEPSLGRESATVEAILARAQSLVGVAVKTVFEDGLVSAFDHYVRMNLLVWPEPKPLHLPGLLLKATVDVQPADHTAGWEPCLPGSLVTKEVQASHESLLRDPHAEAVARVATRFLAGHDSSLSVTPKEETA